MIDPIIFDSEKKFIFCNWSDRDFTNIYNCGETIVKAGETIELPMHKAYHFTRNFVDREMLRNKLENSMSSDDARIPYEVKTLTEITANIDSPALANLKEQIKEEIAIVSGKKPAKKIVPKDSKKGKVEVKEFEALN